MFVSKRNSGSNRNEQHMMQTMSSTTKAVTTLAADAIARSKHQQQILNIKKVKFQNY